MNIEDAVRLVAGAADGSVLVAKPPLTWGAEARFVELTDDGGMPAKLSDEGFRYLIERVDLLELLQFLSGKQLSSRATAEFVVHYAIYDCPPAWINDVPNRK